MPSQRDGGARSHFTDVGGRAAIVDRHLLGGRAIGINHGEIVALPAVAIRVDQREDDVTGIPVVEGQYGMAAKSIHKVKSERNHEVLGGSGIEGDIIVSVGHHVGTDGAVRLFCLVERDEFIIRRQGSHHHLRQLITHIIDQDAKVGSLARIEEAVGVIVI